MRVGKAPAGPFEELGRRLLPQRHAALLVDADDLLVRRDEAGFRRRRPIAVDHDALAGDTTALSVPRNASAAASAPTTPPTPTKPPSAAIPAAAFAAPPGWYVRSTTSRTGTGASGEMRDTSPQTYVSSITSPTTTTRTSPSSSIEWQEVSHAVPPSLWREALPSRPREGRDRLRPDRADRSAACSSAGLDVRLPVAHHQGTGQIESELGRRAPQ